MNLGWMRRHQPVARYARGRWRFALWAAVGSLALCTLALCIPASAARLTSGPGTDGPRYQATIVRTSYGIPHITASNFRSLGYGYGFALASDDLCTMANAYITVEGKRSLYFGASGSVPMTTYTNLQSDIFWRSVIDRHVIEQALNRRSGQGAIGSRLRQLISGYAAGYNAYLASVGGSAGVPDSTCRGKTWVRPINALDAYLLIYEDTDMRGDVAYAGSIASAQPPASTTATATSTSANLMRQLGEQLSPSGLPAGLGSNAIAVGSAGTRDQRHGILLGNPHFPWAGSKRFYDVQLTIPGTLNVEGGSLYGVPLVVIGFTSSAAWSLTDSTAVTITPYQLTLVAGHPTQYLYGGTPVAMSSQTVTVETTAADGSIVPVSRTLWFTRYGPVISALGHMSLPWTPQTAFALADANADNFRFLSQLLAIDQAHSVREVLTALGKYQGLPFTNTIAADSSGHALYADIQAIPHVTNAEAAQCDTALGAISFPRSGMPVLDGSNPSCAWRSDADSAVAGIFGPAEEPSVVTTGFVENSNNSYWMADPASPLTGYPRIVGAIDTPLSLRARSAIAMVTGRITGSDGLGQAGFTLQNMKNLMFSDIEYGATLVKSSLVSMCESFPGGLAPTSAGTTISVGDSCDVLAAWDGTEQTGSRGAVLFRVFWERALATAHDLWLHPFSTASPLTTPNGLNTASTKVQQAFGDALAALTAAKLPYDVALGTVQYVVRDGAKIPLPGGPGDPEGEFNAIYDNVLRSPGTDPSLGSSYIQAVTWGSGGHCPEAATLVAYSESANPSSPHYADQTELFSKGQWVTADFCPAQVAAHAISTTVLHG